MADPITAITTAAPTVISSVFGNSAADTQAAAAQQAAAASTASADKATQLQREIWQAQQAAQAPYQAVGTQSINALANMMGLAPSAASAQNPQYVGMTRNQVRASLLPSYTTQVKSGGAQQFTPPPASAGPNAMRQYVLNTLNARSAPVQTQSVVNEAALNAEIDKIMAQQQGQPSAQATPQSADFGTLVKPFTIADYQADPGYGFRLQQGMNALQNSAAARGGLLSGNTLRGIQDYGQGLASQEYQSAYDRYQQQKANQFNRLASMAGVGQTAVGALGQAGQNYATNVGNIGMQAGANTGNALLAAGQARASSMQGLGSALGGVNWGGIFGGGKNYGGMNAGIY